VLRIKFSAGRQFSASKSASSPSAKTLYCILEMKYRRNKYLTLKGKIQEVILPDSTYAGWIVYENNEPIFYVNIFNYKSKSDNLVNVIITESESDFNDILTDINKRFNRNLTLSLKKNIAIKISSKLMESDLSSLPFEWIEHYTKFIKAPWEKYPDINPNDMFWRMGKGEDAISIFARYYNSLNKTEKNNFKTKYEPTAEWSDFYE